jgi:hypothetical protein
VVEFGEWFLDDVALPVSHRHIVFGISKMIRRCFLYKRSLLAGLSRAAYESLKEYMAGAGESASGCVCSIQTFGDFLAFNPHCHIIISDGVFEANGGFSVNLFYDTHTLEQLFQHKVLKLLLDEGAIGEWHVNLLLSWRHSGFNVHVGDPIPADDREALEKLAHYIIRCPFSQERMTYHAATRTVTYKSKDGKSRQEFSALDWLASIIYHIPNRWEQMVRYYGYYSNASRGKRKKLGMDDGETPVVTCCCEEETDYRKKCRANWARLITLE